LIDTILENSFCLCELADTLLSPVFYIFGVVTGLAIFYFSIQLVQSLQNPKKPLKRGEARNAAPTLAAENGASAVYQKVKTAEIELPVIAATVLTYKPGELGKDYPEETRLYYSEEALKDPDYLDTVMRSPLQIETHEKNTSEFNRGVDGWPNKAFWDEKEKRVKIRGVVHGEDNIAYIEANKDKPDFGTSAFISFLEVDHTAGMTPDGQPYDAVVRKAVNNHLAILPNPRDPRNIVLAMNALDKPESENSEKIPVGGFEKAYKGKSAAEIEKLKREAEKSGPWHKDKDYEAKRKELGLNQDESKNNGAKNMDYDEFKGHMNTYNEEQDKAKKLTDEITNNVMEKLAGENKGGKNEDAEKKEEKEETKNEDTEKKEEKDETANAANALPSDAMLKDFSEHLGITFPTAPTIKGLASLVGVTGATDAELIGALNAKRTELLAGVKNSSGKESESSIDGILRTF